MPDDFDLFPDRKNLDPFSFGKEDKAQAGEKAAPAERPAAPPPTPAAPAPAPAPAPASAPMPSLFDAVEMPLEGGAEPAPAAPAFEREATEHYPPPRRAAKGPSKLVVFGGIILVILGLAYVAQTYLFSPGPVPSPAEPVAATPAVQPQEESQPAPVSQPAEPLKPPSGDKPVAAAKAAAPAEKPAPAAKPAPPVPAATGKGFMVQVGGAAVKENLDAMVKTVKGAGYEPVLVPGVARAPSDAPGPGGAVTVMSGPFAGLAAAEAGAGRLQEAGIPAILVKGDGERYSIKSGSFASAEGAGAQLAKIKGLGLPVRLEGKGLPAAATKAGGGTRLTLVRVGPYADEAEAIRVRDQLAGKGFQPILIRP
jgi:cell division protein FtsN